jgi:hypothetical protein
MARRHRLRGSPQEKTQWCGESDFLAEHEAVLAACEDEATEESRDDLDALTQFCFADQKKRPWRNADCHRRWQALVSAHPRSVILAPIEHAKTEQLAIARTLWELGRNPNLRAGLCCNTYSQAAKVLGAIRDHVARNEKLRRVFPSLRPGEPWTGSAINLAGRAVGIKDYSIQAFGVHGSVLGTRLDWLVMDDVCDYENTRTPAGRADAVGWIKATLLGRLTADARAVLIGTSWHPDDVPHTFMREGWPAIVDRAIVADGTPLWPEQWPLARLEAKRQEIGSWEFARQLLNEPHDEATSRVKRAWIDAALHKGTRTSDGRGGVALSAVDLKREGDGDGLILVGMDLAASRRAAADDAAMVSLLVRRNRTRRLLCVEGGKWTAPEMVQRIADHNARYSPIFWVENNATQDLLLQTARWLTTALVRPHTTGSGQASLQFEFEKFAVELEQGLWEIPSINGQPASGEVAKLIQDILYYAPDKHMGDRLAALLIARAHADENFGAVIPIGASQLMGRW